jgi:hypothetical protein
MLPPAFARPLQVYALLLPQIGAAMMTVRLSNRQYVRIVDSWVNEMGFDTAHPESQ